ncbi:MAG: hypothetical protein OEM01_03005 [Desulfobulbaceae bacterium]|nr:hypothetical protein [Desulfobulbaceae bacterium]
MPVKNLLFKSQIFGNPEERRLPEGSNGTGAFSFGSFSLDKKKMNSKIIESAEPANPDLAPMARLYRVK